MPSVCSLTSKNSSGKNLMGMGITTTLVIWWDSENSGGTVSTLVGQ